MAHENARQTVADFIGARSSKEIVFTRGTTESINLVATAFTERFCKAATRLYLLKWSIMLILCLGKWQLNELD